MNPRALLAVNVRAHKDAQIFSMEGGKVTTAHRTSESDALLNRDSITRRTSAIVPWGMVLILTFFNFATLLVEQVHDLAFGVVASVASVAGQAISSAVLERSPTKAKARAVDGATKRLQVERADLLNRNKVVQAEAEALRASKAALAKEHNELMTVTARRASAVKAVATRTTTVLATRTAEAVATLPARAAPYVGVAALIAFTGVELKADCEVARALAELNAEHGNAPIDISQVCAAIDRVPSAGQTWNSVKAGADAALRKTYEALERIW